MRLPEARHALTEFRSPQSTLMDKHNCEADCCYEWAPKVWCKSIAARQLQAQIGGQPETPQLMNNSLVNLNRHNSLVNLTTPIRRYRVAQQLWLCYRWSDSCLCYRWSDSSVSDKHSLIALMPTTLTLIILTIRLITSRDKTDYQPWKAE